MMDHQTSCTKASFDDAESGSDDTSSSECDDVDDYYSYLENELDDTELKVHWLLERDLELVKDKYGSQKVSVRTYPAFDNLDIELCISMTFLDGDIADAWQIKRDEPLIIRLHDVSASQYLDALEPKVEVFQPSRREKFGVGQQMTKILETFVSEQWKNLNNDHFKNHQLAPPVAPPRKRRLCAQASNPAVRKEAALPDSAEAKLIEIGFSAEEAQNALKVTGNDEQEAASLLMSQFDAQHNNENSCESKEKEGNCTIAQPKPSRPPRVKSQKSPPGTLGYLSWLPAILGRDKKGSSSDGHMDNPKQVPGLESGFLVMVMRYAAQRLGTLNEFCVVCDRHHVFTNSGMLKPAVCARELCVFAFQTLGVMSNAADDIATGAEVVDLLIALAKAACFNTRKELIFDPYPTIVDPSNPGKVVLTPKHKDFKKVEAALHAFPTMSKMVELVGSELKKYMDKSDQLAYPLLQWIISSNRSHIVKLPPEKQLSFMCTAHQYLLLSSPPAQEAEFQEAKAQYGSTYAFHGSNIENWHSIIRQGLVNASGTKLQKHGTAYGAGIYLSPHSNVSFSYSHMGSKWKKTTGVSAAAPPKPSTGPMKRFLKVGGNLTCIALCEVITNKELRKNGSIWVMPKQEYVTTRFFFIYEDGQYGDETVDTEGPGYKKAILQALGFQAS